MNTNNLKAYPGYIISTDLVNGNRVFKEEFDRYYSVMLRAADDADISNILVANAVLNFPMSPNEEDDSVEDIMPVDNLFRVWPFHHVTAEQFGKIVVATKLGLLSPKDAQATDKEILELDPYPADLSYTVVAETKDGKQEIIRMPIIIEQNTNKESGD